jgi:hypothetical protein
VANAHSARVDFEQRGSCSVVRAAPIGDRQVNSDLGQQRGGEILGDVGHVAGRGGDATGTADDQDTAREQCLVAAGSASPGSARFFRGRLAGAEEGDDFELAGELVVRRGTADRGEDLRERLIAQRYQLIARAIEEPVDN